MLAPSHAREARSAKRRNGGVVRTTYAAAAPADRIKTFAIVRAVAGVTCRYPHETPDEPRELSEPLPCAEDPLLPLDPDVASRT